MNDSIIAYKKKFEEFLFSNIPKIAPKELFDPYLYLLNLDAKRLRPILLLAIKNCYGDLDRDVFHVALSIELFHNFTLMHDDIMDQSDTRRGFPSTHKKFDENSAILSGDAMLILSYQLLEKLENQAHFPALFKLFNTTALAICTGQRLDMNYENDLKINELDYIIMIENKTAVLLAACLQMGAILGNASISDQKALYEFGLNIGIAFQIQDDLLDSFGNSDETGKLIGGDICNNKKTLLFIFALQNAHVTHRDLLSQWTQTKSINTDKINEIRQIFIDSGAKEYTIKKRDHYFEKAMKCLETVLISENQKEILISFAKKAVERIK